MRDLTKLAIASLVFSVVLTTGPVFAESVFTIENPDVDFEVVDAEPFDGLGDNGPYSTFNDVVLGTEGAARSMAEFDISAFNVPPGEIIYRATFEVIITATEIYGLGVNGETPESVAADGYMANGVAELSDFQAGDGNKLDSVATPDPQVGDILSFDVTTYIVELVELGHPWVGLTARAQTFGGLWTTEGGVYPRLEILTGLPGDVDHDGDVDLSDLAQLLSNYGTLIDASYEDGDIDRDGDVDLADLAELLAHYGS